MLVELQTLEQMYWQLTVSFSFSEVRYITVGRRRLLTSLLEALPDSESKRGCSVKMATTH